MKTKKIKPSALQAAKGIYEQDGISGFWRGIGPALILVINPVIQVSPLNLYHTAPSHHSLASIISRIPPDSRE